VSNSRKLDRMVADLLDLDRLTRGIVEPKLSDTDVGALVRHLVGETDFLDGQRVTVEAEPVVLAVDASKIEHIVENLLTNAVRHTSPASHIWVRVAAEDGGAMITVEDDGPGVPDDMKEAIFEVFQRGPEAAGTPGTGIGLSLVARFAGLHGGRAWVEDRTGGGASFHIFLPGNDVAS
jgi:signal transduction histidine kinase